MSYDIAIWEQIRSKVEWKTWSLEKDIIKEIRTIGHCAISMVKRATSAPAIISTSKGRRSQGADS